MMKTIVIKSSIPPTCRLSEVKEYALFENNCEVIRGSYALAIWKRDQRIAVGIPRYLLKIKPIKK